MTRARDLWQTPQYIRQMVDGFYQGPEPWFDPCPTDPDFDGLKVEWGAKCFVNPPYSNPLPWVQKGVQEYGRLFTAVKWPEQIWLVRNDHSTQWFRHLVVKATAILLVRKRIQFDHPFLPTTGSSKVVNTFLYLGHRPERFEDYFGDLGYIFYAQHEGH